MVEVRFNSQPAGAEVYQAGNDRSLGRTPMSWKLPASDRKEVFELRISGYEVARREISLRQDAYVGVALLPSKHGKGRGGRAAAAPGANTDGKAGPPAPPGAAAPPPPAKEAEPALDRSGVLNPFQE
jgi:hypothetical protein